MSLRAAKPAVSASPGGPRIDAAGVDRPVALTVQPHLHLTTETLFRDDGSERTVAAVRLAFGYGNHEVRVGRRSHLPRDRAAENLACRLLESYGAVEVAALEDAAVSPGAQVDYLIRPDGDATALCTFAADALPRLRAEGWRVEIDPSYPWQVVAAEAPVTCGVVADERRPDWFGVELGVDVDGHRVDLLPPLLELLDDARDLDELTRPARRYVAVQVAPRRWLPLPPERVRRLLGVLAAMVRDGDRVGCAATRAPLLAELGCALHDPVRPLRWEGQLGWRDAGYALAMGPALAPAAPPRLDALCADLRGYQRDGVAWLQHLRAHGAGGVLADDMGLGKTLQAIAHLVAERAAGRLVRPALVVTLTSCAGNWEREFARFAPGLRVLGLRAADRAARLGRLGDIDVAVTTYPLLVRDREALAAQPWSVAIFDEAHTIKNQDSQAAGAARGLTAEQRVALTGTPVENHLGELWSVVDCVQPGLLGEAEAFRTEFRVPIEQRGDAARLAALRARVRPFLLRRTKEACAPELPPKTRRVDAIDLTGAQRELYESIRVSAHADVRAAIRARGVAGAQIQLLDALLKLRQACCDPRLVRLDAAASVPESAKLTHLLSLLERQLAAGHRVLVFSQFARMLALISEALLARGVRHVTLTGATADRQRPIDAFERGAADVFLISLRAGGTGLNLTSADTVLHYDPWWNPATQAQATDRAHRIGQRRPVFVHDLVIAGSVEERMLALQAHKRRLAAGILGDTDAGGPTGLTEREVDDLLAPLA